MKDQKIDRKDQTIFAINTAKVFSGNFLSQAILILTTPVITRLFPPEEFGLFGVFATIVSFLTVVICLKYELAIVVTERIFVE